MFNTWQIILLLNFSLTFCYYNKQLLSVLGLVHYELDTNKKCPVSLVVKYISSSEVENIYIS